LGGGGGFSLMVQAFGQLPSAPGDFSLLTPSPQPLTSMAVDPIFGYIYAQENAGTSFYRYAPLGDSWTTLSSSPINSDNNGGAVYQDGKIYTVYTNNDTEMGIYDITETNQAIPVMVIGHHHYVQL